VKRDALPLLGQFFGVGGVQMAVDHRIGAGFLDQLGEKRGLAAGAEGRVVKRDHQAVVGFLLCVLKREP